MKTAFIFLGFLMFSCPGITQVPECVYDLQSGSQGLDPRSLTEFNGKLFFSGNDGPTGTELWSYDGTNAPSRIFDLNPGTENGSVPINGTDIVSFNNKLYFKGDNGSSGFEIMVYDGISAPSIFADIAPGLPSSYPESVISFGNRMFFAAQEPSAGRELYSYDGTGIPVRYDMREGTQGSGPSYLHVHNGIIYFSANITGNGHELSFFNPANYSFSMLADIYPGESGSFPTDFISAEGKLFFTAANPEFGHELYSYDGNVVERISDVAEGPLNGVAFSRGIAYYNGAIYFSGSETGAAGSEFYKFDLATSQASIANDISFGDTPDPKNYIVYNGSLYFVARSTSYGNEIFKYEGNEAEMLWDINPGDANSNPDQFFEWNGSLYFNATNNESGKELYRFTTPSAIDEKHKLNGFRVFPNPAADYLTIELTTVVSTELTVQITDITGRVLQSKLLNTTASESFTVTVSMNNYSPGSYFYHLISKENEINKSGIIIKK